MIRTAAAFIIPLCLLLAFWSFGLLYEGFMADHYSGAFSFPFVDEPAAERDYARLKALTPIADQDAVVHRLVLADPTNPDSWNAAAYVAYEEAGSLSPAAIEALDHSYTVGAFDRTGGAWRVRFAFEHWSALPPRLRDAVLAEARIRLRDTSLGPPLTDGLREVGDPEGRRAATALIATRP